MFDLLLESERRDVLREYRLRLLAVASCALALEVFVAALGGMFSFQALRHEAAVWRSGERVEEGVSQVAQSGTKELIERTSARLALLAAPPLPPLTPGVDGLLSARVPGVRFVSIAAEASVAEGGWTLTAQGIAETRDALALFERALSARRAFTGVAIPVESFAKEAQAPFSLRALYHPPPL